MEGLGQLTVFSIVMLVGSYGAGSAPLFHTVRNRQIFSKNYLVYFNDPKCFKIMRNIFWTFFGPFWGFLGPFLDLFGPFWAYL